jgi:hypothetical protein
MRFSSSSLFSLAFSMCAQHAHAQSFPAERPVAASPHYYALEPDLVPVRITSDTPGVQVWLRRAEDEAAVVYCAHSCVAYVPRGKYRLDIPSTANTLGGTPRVKVDGPTAVSVRAPDHSSRWVGLGTALGGHGIMAGGIALILSNMCVMGTCEGSSELRGMGMLMTISGGIMAPIGWTHFGKNVAARARVTSFEPHAVRRRRAPSIQLAAGQDGIRLHTAMRF